MSKCFCFFKDGEFTGANTGVLRGQMSRSSYEVKESIKKSRFDYKSDFFTLLWGFEI